MELNYLKIKKLIPILLLFAFILILFILIFPAYNNTRNLRAIIKTKQEVLKNQKEQVQLFEELQKSKKFEKLNQILPDKPEIPELMIQLETMASQNNLILKSINFTEGQNEITVQTNLAGSYNALKNYLKALENNLRLMDVVSLNFQASKDGSFCDFNLVIKAYYDSGQETKNIAD